MSKKPLEIVLASDSSLSNEVVDLTESMAEAAEQALWAKADNTRRAYRAALKTYSRWCASKNLHLGGKIADPITGEKILLPAEVQTIVLYMHELANGKVPEAPKKGRGRPLQLKARRPSTIDGHLSAIRYFHERLGLTSPTLSPEVKTQRESIQNFFKGGMKVQKEAVLGSMLPELVAGIGNPNSAIGIRDTFIILFGFGGAFRRDEITHVIKWKDIVPEDDGLAVWLAYAKNDQRGLGRQVLVHKSKNPAICPLAAHKRWKVALEAEGLPVTGDSPVFVSLSRNHWGQALSGNKVALVVKDAIEAAGYDPAAFAGHSLRAGWITTALAAGIPIEEVKKKPGHKRSDTTDGYNRRIHKFDTDPGKGLT